MDNQERINEYLKKFKCILEYFVAHLHYVQTNDESGIGYTEYIKPLKDNNDLQYSGQGYKGQQIQKQVKNWDSYGNYQLCINITPVFRKYTTRNCYLNWKDTGINVSTGINIIAGWKDTDVESLGIYEYWGKSSWENKGKKYTLKELGLFEENDNPTDCLADFFKCYYEMIVTYSENRKYMNYIKLLDANHNIILTGAPGTGKTYMAKQIAAQMILNKEYDKNKASDEEKKKMDKQCVFVQFHPSYDYTDFVEGLRPKQNESGQVVFERKDGVFKTFCKNAIKSRIADGMDDFEAGWKKLVDYLNDNPYIEIPLLSGTRNICVELNEYGTGLAERQYSDGNSVGNGEWVRGHSKFFTKEQLYNIYRGLNGTPSGGHDNYRRAIVKYMIDQKWMSEYREGHEISESSKYVFIIDEINRGEISKIFGELFFAIDPGYRGTGGRVKTQYQNLVDEDDVFYNGFYVPDNVYIIGTMNDIDRSVESMDFAFRRRFVFMEVTAKDSQKMLYSEPALSEKVDEIIDRMNALNGAICPDKKDLNKKGIEGLSSAYHIGASYFLKLANYMKDGVVDYQKLWDNHLKGLLFEYLRGMPDAEEKLDALGKAFGIKSSDSDPS